MAAISRMCSFVVVFTAMNICFVVTKHISLQKRFTKDDKCNVTPTEINACPENDAQLQERSEMMKCDSYPKCIGEELVYHCVRYKTKLVEVCAPRLHIVCGHKPELGGCCAVFEDGLGRVVIDFNIICHECPMAYYSDKTTKYSTCVQTPDAHQYSTTRQVNVEGTDFSNQTERSNFSVTHQNITHYTKNEDPTEYILIAVIIPIIVIFVAAITSICMYRYCYRKKKNIIEDYRHVITPFCSTCEDKCAYTSVDIQQMVSLIYSEEIRDTGQSFVPRS